MEAKVILKNLVKGVEFNGKGGIIKGGLKEGRHEVLVGKRFLNIKPANLEYEMRPIEKLSVQELKNILKEKDDKVNFAGMDASDLRRQVTQFEPEEAMELLAKGTYRAKLQKAKDDAQRMKQQADQITQTSPDQLRQQARMMRSMPPQQIRSMNAQLRHMTDAQILQAADQMEQMADNPEMLQMAANQFKNMSPEQIQRAQGQATGAPPAEAAGYGTRPGAGGRATTAAEALQKMTPDQFKQQAQMMRSMTPDQIRSMNPHMANFTDAQIQQAATQMEMMADNPEMMDMARQQMQNLSPEELKLMQETGQMPEAPLGGGGGMPSAQDAAKMLEQMDGKQLKKMMNMMKQNPDMLSKMPGMGGKSEAEMKKMLSMFEGMSDEQMDAAVSALKKVEKYTKPVRNVWTTVNGFCGGHLLKVLVLIVVSYIGLFIYLRFVVAPAAASGGVESLVQEAADPVPVMDEAETEF